MNSELHEERVRFEITKFIKNCKQFDKDNAVTKTFTNGYCYWFAHILFHRFSKYNPKIVYYEVGKHFAVKIYDRVYDITGDITAKNLFFEDWEEYQKSNPEETKVIYRTMINKIF